MYQTFKNLTMKNKKTTLIAGLAIALLSPAQGVGQSYAELDINNVRAGMTSEGVLFNDGTNPAFEVPAGSGLHSFYNTTSVLSGIDINGQLVQTQSGFYETYAPGPVSMNPANNANYYGVFKVNRAEIDAHIANYGTPGYVLPLSIQNWPAHGNVAEGESRELAPYYDYDGDDNYVPYNGDYPLIKGDQAIFSITHYSMGQGVGIEMHTMLYAYACSSDGLDQAVFADIKYYNRSTTNIYDTYVGHLTDMDIGDADFDYVQTEVELGSFYTFDVSNNATGYSLPSAQSITVLAGPFQDADGADNANGIGFGESLNGWGYGDGTPDNERLGLTYSIHPSSGSTGNAIGVFNSLRGVMPNGSPYTVGSPPVPYRYAYPGTSDPQAWGTNGSGPYQWDELGVGNVSGDRVGVTSSGPFFFAPDQMVQLEEVFIFESNNQITSTLPTTISNIRNSVASGITPCGNPIVLGIATSDIVGGSLEEVSLYPNPASEAVTLELPNTIGAVDVRIINALGQEVLFISQVASRQQLDVQQLNSGVYFVNIQSDHHERTLRLVVQ